MYRQRIVESYQHLAKFARDEIARLVKRQGKRWIEQLKPEELPFLNNQSLARRLNRLVQKEPLVSRAYYIESNGTVRYPEGLKIPSVVPGKAFQPGSLPKMQNWLLQFQKLTDLAEELEFKKNKPDSALLIYRKIVQQNPVPRLQAIALSQIARIYMFKADWATAYRYYQRIIREYPGARDLNNLHLRFDAQFQCVIALENMGKLEEAMRHLLDLYRDLLDHSDEVNRNQFEFFVERIQKYYTGLIGAFSQEKQAQFNATFQQLQEKKKKSIGTTYLLQKLHQRLIKAIIKRTTYRPRFKYLSDYAVEQPYLVAYMLLSDTRNSEVKAVLGLEINLDSLKATIFPHITGKKNFPEDVVIAIVDKDGKFVMGETERILGDAAAKISLRDPLNFWQLGIYPTYNNPLVSGKHFGLYVKLWGTFLLLLVIIIGSVVAISNMRKQQMLSLQKSTFISSISHELRTPLTSIQMFVDLLSRDEELMRDARRSKFLKIISGESERLMRLIDNVLDYSKIERGIKKYHFEYEEPQAIIRSVVEAFRYQSEVHGVTIHTELPEALPEVYVDRDAISQALINLLSNAVKFSPDKKPVVIRAFIREKFLHIQVQDQGIGIQKKHLKYIFDDFYRVEEGKAGAVAGTGLGLPLVKHIVEAHHGQVTVESRYGEGTIFTIILPIPESEAPA